MKKISILLPSLNVVDYIGQCIESVINQTMEDIEIICIDAGSTDGTLEIIRYYADRDDRIRLVKSEIKSYGYQMNLGIHEAQGEYIGIVETDDWVDPDMYEILYRKAKLIDADVAKGILYEVYEPDNGEAWELYVDYITDDRAMQEVFSPEEDPSVHAWDGNIWNGIYRKSFLVNHNISFNESPGAAFQDIGFQQMVLNEASIVLFLHNNFYHYRKVRPGASTWNPRCLRYLYNEYHRLFEMKCLKESRLKWVYSRMVSAFLFEYDKAMSYAGFNKDQIECPEAVEWFDKMFRNALTEGILVPEDVKEQDRLKFYTFMLSRDNYIAKYAGRMKRASEWIKEIKDKIKKERLVVVGAGRYGLCIEAFFMVNGLFVSCVADNQRWIRNQSYYGIRIVSPDEAIRLYPDAFYMIANKKNGEAIAEQLVQGGINHEKMLFFDGSDNVLFEAIETAPILV